MPLSRHVRARLAKLAPGAFAQAFGRWMAAACDAAGLVPIAVDGKSARRAKRDTATGRLTVSAWATRDRLSLGQVAVPDGSNEVAATPALLNVLDLPGAIVTIDAAGRQTENAPPIRAGKGHYLFTARGSRPAPCEAVRAVFERADGAGLEDVRFGHRATAEDGHGRHEERHVSVIDEPTGLPSGWPDVAAVASVPREARRPLRLATTSPVTPARPPRSPG